MFGRYGDKCSQCHSWLLGRPKNMFLKSYGLTKSWAESCKWKKRTRTEDLGEMIKKIDEKKGVGRCPKCGRKEEASAWLQLEVEKEWKDGGC